MFDKSEYLQTIVHADCADGIIESSTSRAFKIDDGDGIAKAIGFHAGIVNKVDYFVVKNNDVQLIELSDLEEQIHNCHVSIAEELQQLREVTGGDITKREENKIIKTAWKEIKIEFCKKWCGSIAVIERLYRKTNELGDADPNYKLLIVCKNHTDIRMLDGLKAQLSGMMGNVVVCKTETLNNVLIGPEL
ncbi:MAG: hypothetical protein M0R41_02940 [Methylobacter tundripaludum]|uniref:Uncharacterized protein n=1 Tax=Methylobacter tundripaludum TaxID=173365 RepID=A0A2S6H601_9GAMM|nr:hypothetical protein [Methylobacter tundripaludum]MCK9635220.1 hypothetical protein [Methylobacter tundripaludum]PPK72898.1 hypothetical protein B0F88_103336 [Methylobacter tundripaludum]